MNTDTISGKFDQLKGAAKQTTGEAVGNEDLANSGTVDQVKGSAKEAWGSVKDAVHANTTNAQVHAEQEKAEARAHGEETAHNVRESVVAAAQNVKNFVSGKADESKH